MTYITEEQLDRCRCGRQKFKDENMCLRCEDSWYEAREIEMEQRDTSEREHEVY